MELRPYQKIAMAEVEERFKSGDKEVVLAACPSSGKTEMAISFIQNHPDQTFLILAHSTIVIREQWGERFKENGMTVCEDFSQRVTYAIPQTIHRKKGKIDVLVIDEAHENTFADSDAEGMIERIKKNFRVKKILYLTGTPSKFILRGMNPIIIPAVQLVPEYISDLYFGMISTHAPILNKHYNADDEVDAEAQEMLCRSTERDLDDMLDGIVRRLSEVNFIKTKPMVRQLLKWAPLTEALHKTMVACRSIKQASAVHDYFIRHGVKSVTSNTDTDPENLEVWKFVQDPETTVLVVVGRGILGFNMTDLVNVVDLTCSRNVDRIYQLYARVMRKSADYPHKFFFKLSTEEQMELSKFYMTAALMMMRKEFIERYNGKNLNDCEVLVQRPSSERKEKSENGGGERKTQRGNFAAVDEFFYGEVSSCKLMDDILNKIGRGVNEYAKVTIEEVKIRLGLLDRLTAADFHELAASKGVKFLGRKVS